MAAVEVSIDELDSWLKSQPVTTIDAPYLIKITGLTSENLTKITSSLGGGGSKYVDLSETILPSGIRSLQGIFSSCMNLVKSPEIPNTVTNLEDCFFACIHLLEAPVIPDSVTNLRRTFQGCSSLVKTPVLPNNITTLFGTFKGCTSLTEVSNFPNSLTDLPHAFFNCSSLRKVPEFPQGITNLYYAFTGATALTDLHLEDFFKFYSITSDKYAFTGCTNLKNFYTNYPYACKEWVKGLYNKGDRFPNDPDSCNFITYVSYSELENWLSTQVENSISSPYKVIITDIAPQDCGSLGELIQRCGRYVDLSGTILPEGLTSLMIDRTEEGIFERCEYLVEPPVLPSTLTSTERGFSGCTSLKTAPIIPEGVTEISDTFRGCTSLEEAPVIPSTVTDLERAFENCSSLTEPPIIPDSAINLAETFSGCTSLTYKVAANYLHSNTYEGVATTHWKGRADQLQYLFAANVDVTEYEILETGQVLHFENGALIIPISELDSALQSFSENTVGSAYKIKITELTTENIGDIKTALRNNSEKYVDLSATILPEVTNLNRCFSQCSTLVESPILPNSLEEMEGTFTLCENLKTFPVIPASVTNMNETFYECHSVDGEIDIPQGVVNLNSTFQDCSSLTITPTIPNGVTRLDATFCRCSSLTEFPEIPEGVTRLVDTFEGCVLVTEPPVIPSSVTIFESTFLDCTGLQTPPVLPDSLEWLVRAFSGCTSLQEMPDIPETVIYMNKAFSGCGLITETTLIPENVVSLSKAFENCTSLTTVKFGNLDYETLIEEAGDQEGVFKNCNNLQIVYTDKPYGSKSWLTSLYEASTDNIPVDPSTLTYKLLSSPIEIPLANLSNDLATLEENTLKTPFNIKVTDITSSNLSSFKSALTNNPTKYVDLHTTELPEEINIFNNTFEDCTTLVKAPALPDDATDIGGMFAGCTNLKEVPELTGNIIVMSGTFLNCTSLTEVPEIPSRVENMYQAFFGCENIESVEHIPASVTTLSQAFNGCSSLQEIKLFEVPLNVLESSAADCFKGCTSLASIAVPRVETEEDDKWHIVFLEITENSIKGKVYTHDSETKVTSIIVLPETSVDKDKLRLLGYTDELWFPEAESTEDIEDLIERIIENRYGYYNKTVIPPDKKSFVLYAADKNSVISNLDLGGGGEGQGLAFIGTEAEFNEALSIPFGEPGYIYPNSLSLITDKSNYLVGEIHNE